MGDVRIWRLPRYSRGACHAAHLGTGVPVRFAVNHQLESRVREIRTHGSEGGGAEYSTGSSYPYLAVFQRAAKGADIALSAVRPQTANPGVTVH